MADAIVRNDEVVGSIPTSSTKFSSTYNAVLVQSCHTLSQKFRLSGLPELPQNFSTEQNELDADGYFLKQLTLSMFRTIG